MTTKHTYEALILADSISPAGHRLTTMQWTFPRFILAELNTHKMIGKSSASSRAIPVEKRIAAVREHMFIPESFGRNRPGMQATEVLAGDEAAQARQWWIEDGEEACRRAERLAKLGVHKQYANREIELWSWHTAILTATDWDNMFALRCHPDAQPEFRIVAELARAAMGNSEPKPLVAYDWHMPLVGAQYGDQIEGSGLHPMDWCRISAARCARVSYLTHDGRRDVGADLELYNRLVSSGHMSPPEHTARPMDKNELERYVTYGYDTAATEREDPIGSYLGNLNGWVSLRKTIPGERVFQAGAR